MLTWLKRRAWPVIERTYRGWQEKDGFLLSAAMAYYAAFSLFPLLLVLIAILGFVMRLSPQAHGGQEELLKLVGERTDQWLADQLKNLLEGVQMRAGLGGPVGFIALVIAAIGVFMQLDYIFDRIWEVKSSSKIWLAYVRDVIWDRVSAFLMLMGVGALLVAVFVANMVFAGVLVGLRSRLEGLPAGAAAWQLGQIVLTLVMYTLLFGLVYKVLPKPRIPWSHALTGGAFVSVVWLVGQQLLVSFVIGTHYSAYGVVGSFIAVMLWLYYASAIVFLGAELVRAIGQATSE
jgi:membrane protein